MQHTIDMRRTPPDKFHFERISCSGNLFCEELFVPGGANFKMNKERRRRLVLQCPFFSPNIKAWMKVTFQIRATLTERPFQLEWRSDLRLGFMIRVVSKNSIGMWIKIETCDQSECLISRTLSGKGPSSFYVDMKESFTCALLRKQSLMGVSHVMLMNSQDTHFKRKFVLLARAGWRR